MGGFKIVHEVDNKEIMFKFHQKSKLQGGASVTVSFPSIIFILFHSILVSGVGF